MRATGVEDIHSALQQTASNNYVLVASFAVYLFDRTLLSGQEASYIWRYRLSMVPALTILLHGTTILNFALLCYEQMVDLDCKATLPVNIASEVALALFDSIIALITALRVYAINNRDWRIPFLVFLLSLIRTAYDLFGTGTKTGLVLPSPLGCAVVSTSSINGSYVLYPIGTHNDTQCGF
ncbi:hypothetical protein C8Q72DRAFT_836389 [Fomitopsis betulina]|nr:hypothetical protein C8Q72DRAFT_836389 [Fomitopsis betulina]